MTFQVHDLKYVTLPPGWDASYLALYRMSDGITLDRVVADINAALTLFNGEMPWYWPFITFQDNPEVEYGQGNLVTEPHSEYTPPTPQRADFTGHMLPVLERDSGFKFTEDFFVKGSMSRVDASVRAGIDAYRQLNESMIVRRALRRTDDTGATQGLGSGGISPGFATAAANTGVDYQPPMYGGEEFTTDHEHYTSVAAASLATGLNAKIATLREHGHAPPFDLWISTEDVPTVTALTNFVGIQPVSQVFPSDVERTTGNPTIPAGAVPYYIGSYGDGQGSDAWVRVVPRVPQYYYFVSKPYGHGDPRNPFHVRWDPRWGPRGVRLRASQSNYPLHAAYLFQAQGVGVGEDRTNGAALFIDAGATWADATIALV